MTVKKNLLRPVLSAALLLLGWENDSLFFLLFVAFLPLFYVVKDNQSKKRSFLAYYLTFFLFFGLSNIDLFLEGFKTTALISGLIVLPAIWTLPFMLAKWTKERRSLSYSMLAFPFFYATLEVLNYYWEIAFPWHHLGLGFSEISFFDNLFGLVGSEGVGFLICGVNASVFYFLIHYKKVNKLKRKLRRALPLILLLLLLLISTLIRPSLSEKRAVKVAVLHPSSQTYQKLESDTKSQYEYLKQVLERENFQGADLLVCGESYLEDMNRFPLIVNELDSHPAIRVLKKLSVKYHTPIISGAILVELLYNDRAPTFTAKKKEQGVYFDIYNGSVLINPNDSTAWRSKQKFVPITEIYPFLSFFELLYDQKIIEFQGQSSYGTSDNNSPYELGDLTISPQICFENLFPTALKKRGVRDADLQLLLSNDWSLSGSIINKQSSYAQASVNSFGVPLIFAAYNQNAFFHGFEQERSVKTKDFSVFKVNLQTKKTIYPAMMTFYHLFLSFSSILFLILASIKVLEKQ